jgi:hypothetical protein
MLTAGLGRPLLLTTLEPSAAMRVLASEQRSSVLAATGLLVLAATLLALAVAVALLGVGPTAVAAALGQGATTGASPSAATTGALPSAAITATPPPARPAGPGSPGARVDSDVVSPGDPRSEGSGPGLVGSPLLVLLGVVLIGLATAVLTAAAARIAGRS